MRWPRARAAPRLRRTRPAGAALASHRWPRLGYADVTPVSRFGLRSAAHVRSHVSRDAIRRVATLARSATNAREEFPPLTRTMFVRYAGASGDFNPMHHDDTIATQVGNPSVFGHGMLTMGLAARVVKDWFGPEAIAPVPGALLEAGLAGRRAHVHRDGHRQARGRRACSLVDLDVAVVNQNGDKAITGAATAARRVSRWGCSTAGLRSSPVRAAASGASSRCASPAKVRRSSSTTSASSLDGAGTRRDGSGRADLCKEIEAPAAHAVPNYDSVTDFDGAAAHRADRGRRVRHGRHPREQRRASCATARCLKMDEADFDAVVAVHLKGTFNCTRHAAAVMKEQRLRPHHQHHVVGRAARQLRADELRRGQGRHHGHDVRLVDGARSLRHHRERGRAVGRDAHDRRAVRAVGPEAAARGGPGAQRAAGRVPRVGAARRT